MATRMEQADLRSRCEASGFTFVAYSPGDGVIRYRFFVTADPVQRVGCFSGDGDFTAYGWREAHAYASGRIHGIEQGMN